MKAKEIAGIITASICVVAGILVFVYQNAIFGETNQLSFLGGTACLTYSVMMGIFALDRFGIFDKLGWNRKRNSRLVE